MRVVIAEDSVLLREGLTRLLTDRGMEVVAGVGDGDALLKLLDDLAGQGVIAETLNLYALAGYSTGGGPAVSAVHADRVVRGAALHADRVARDQNTLAKPLFYNSLETFPSAALRTVWGEQPSRLIPATKNRSDTTT